MKNTGKLRDFTSAVTKGIPYYLLLLPFFILFTVFVFVPVAASIVLSFTDFNMLQMPKFVGISNYARLFFSDEIFLIALKNTLVFAIIIGPVGYMLSFVVAWLLNSLDRRLRSFLTLIIYSPALVGNMYFIWTYIFAADRRGFLNNILLRLGIASSPIAWLSDTQYNFSVVIVVCIWMSFGTGFLSFIAGFQSLDPTYYEAAAIDGLSNRWQELYYVTFPQMGPQLLFGAVTAISSSFSIGGQCSALTGFPSTDYSTHTLILHIQDYGNVRYEMGYASAIAVFLFAMMLLAWILVNRVLRRFSS